MLDTNVTPKLAAEGLARELVSRVQNLRKQACLSVSARIALCVDASGLVSEMLDSAELRELIQRETLALDLKRVKVSDFPAGSATSAEAIDGGAVTLGLTRAG
jgi:isoleucyl-tRNA synthetase